MPSNPKEYMQQYYKEKREHILERMREPLLCETCNVKITRSNFPKHLRSKKHAKVKESEDKKQITMKEITEQISELKKLVEKVEQLGQNNKPELVLRRVFGSLGKEPEKKKKPVVKEETSSESEYSPTYEESESESD